MKYSLPKKFQARHAASKHSKATLMAAAFLLLASSTSVSGTTSNPFPFQETQPDGQVIDLKLHGDTFDSWMSDMDGYTVLRQKDGTFVYAEEDGQGGLVPSLEMVEHPMRKQSQKSMAMHVGNFGTSNKKKGLRPAKKDCTDLLCGDMQNDNDGRRLLKGKFDHKKHKVDQLLFKTMDALPNNNQTETRTAVRGGGRKLYPLRNETTRKLEPILSGTLRNLVVLIQWKDHKDRVLPSPEELDVLMNHEGPH
ncbi:MAG: hypothetical protein SGILL_002429, partial [Bacillariaceae sp.]